MDDAKRKHPRDILREMPLFITAEQRVRYESIALTTEIMEINLANLFALARSRTEENPDCPTFTREDRAMMMSLAWGIVDQGDLLRRLIAAEGRSIDIRSAQEYMKSAEVVRTLRNWIQHLTERLPSFLNKRGRFPPVHGALSFTYVNPEDAENASPDAPLGMYRTIVILSSAMQRPMEVAGEPYKYDSFNVPIDHFVLQSFGYNLSLVEICGRAGKFCDEFALGVAKFCYEQAARIAVAESRSIEEVMAPSPELAGTLVMRAVLNPALPGEVDSRHPLYGGS